MSVGRALEAGDFAFHVHIGEAGFQSQASRAHQIRHSEDARLRGLRAIDQAARRAPERRPTPTLGTGEPTSVDAGCRGFVNGAACDGGCAANRLSNESWLGVVLSCRLGGRIRGGFASARATAIPRVRHVRSRAALGAQGFQIPRWPRRLSVSAFQQPDRRSPSRNRACSSCERTSRPAGHTISASAARGVGHRRAIAGCRELAGQVGPAIPGGQRLGEESGSILAGGRRRESAG